MALLHDDMLLYSCSTRSKVRKSHFLLKIFFQKIKTARARDLQKKLFPFRRAQAELRGINIVINEKLVNVVAEL